MMTELRAKTKNFSEVLGFAVNSDGNLRTHEFEFSFHDFGSIIINVVGSAKFRVFSEAHRAAPFGL